MHLFIFLKDQDKIRTVQQVDALISTQIPDENMYLQLYGAVTHFMLHGPCFPQRCLENGRCKKHFPKSFCEQTRMNDDGYAEYARPNNGHAVQRNEDNFTNQHVVPHNRELLVLFQCHINVEVCASIKFVKYIHKYIYKGPNHATLETQGHDEVKSYLDSRYISSIEAVWCLLEFSMHLEYPSVYRLPVYLENEQNILYGVDDAPEEVLERAITKNTQLLGWFKVNADADCIAAGAHNCFYHDFPKTFVWAQEKWKSQQCHRAIGHMYSVPPNGGECFYLMLLLTVVKGMLFLLTISSNKPFMYFLVATSYQALWTVNGVLCNIFKDACQAGGLLDDDQEWLLCLQEAAGMCTGQGLHNLFVTILLLCNPVHPHQLWKATCVHLCDDLEHRICQLFPTIPKPEENQIYDYGLHLIDSALHKNGKSLKDFPCQRGRTVQM